ncbi:CcdB family protein [Roseobacter sp. GAI101]|uniref:CcdB family protein n=1 Tax=Roseobacter sp. (strain GAI101) TaxID=391589 RepID=UPI000559F0F8|nr:CcdB family protein [Roseobacter sp. GAI101]
MDVQTDLLCDLNTRVVVPLLPSSIAPNPATTLNPIFEFNDEPVVMVTQFMAAIPTDILKTSVGKLAEEFEKVTTAIDLRIQGF